MIKSIFPNLKGAQEGPFLLKLICEPITEPQPQEFIPLSSFVDE